MAAVSLLSVLLSLPGPALLGPWGSGSATGIRVWLPAGKLLGGRTRFLPVAPLAQGSLFHKTLSLGF